MAEKVYPGYYGNKVCKINTISELDSPSCTVSLVCLDALIAQPNRVCTTLQFCHSETRLSCFQGRWCTELCCQELPSSWASVGTDKESHLMMQSTWTGQCSYIDPTMLIASWGYSLCHFLLCLFRMLAPVTKVQCSIYPGRWTVEFHSDRTAVL